MAQRRSFAQKAALFSLFAPLTVVLLSCIGKKPPDDYPQIALVIDVLSAIVILAGLVAAVVALASIPKQGRKGILWQALGGLGFNSLVAAATP